MKKWIKAVPALLLAVLVIGILCCAGCGRESAEAEEADSDPVVQIDPIIDSSTIMNGIYIGDVSVGGMTAAQATSAIREYVNSISEQPIVLAANNETLKTTVNGLGFTEDVSLTIQEALNYGKTGNLLDRYKDQKDLEREEKVLPLILRADEDQVRDYLEENVWQLNVSSMDYGLTRENGEFVIIEGQAGQAVDVDESVNLIMDSFASGWQENSTIALAVEERNPRGSMEELSQVQDVLGKFATDYSSSSTERKTNIATGAACIDGTVIYPGETFSVEEAVTPFDEEHGYELAGSYENGTTVDTYGGGICQVSTTLYNAVIRAELEINERYGHSMMVSYVDPSADAAIAEGTKDLKFTNTTDAPIYIEGYTDGATISFTVYGHETRPANRTVSFESETTSVTEPTVEYRASSDPYGYITQTQTSHTGATAELWKIVTVDGVEESREVFNNTTYNMSPTIYDVGVNSSNSAAVSALYEAISTQSIDKIYDTISAYSGGGSSSSDSSSESTSDSSEEESESEPEDTDEQEVTESVETPTEDTGGGGGVAAEEEEVSETSEEVSGDPPDD